MRILRFALLIICYCGGFFTLLGAQPSSIDKVIEKAEFAYRTHRFEEGRATLERLLLRQSKLNLNNQQLSKAYCFLGECLYELSEEKSSRLAFENAWKYFSKIDSSLSVAPYTYRIPQGLRTTASSSEEQNKWEAEFFRIIKRVDGYSPEVLASEQYFEGLRKYNAYDDAGAIQNLNKSIEYLRQLDYADIDLYSTYNLLSVVYEQAGNNASALVNHKLALNHCPESNHEQYFNLLVNIAGYHLDLRQEADARRYLKEARQFAKQHKIYNSSAWPHLYSVSYELFHAGEMQDSVRKLLDEQFHFYRLYPERMEEEGYGRYLNQEGAYHIEEAEYKKARSYIDQAIEFNVNNKHHQTSYYLLSKIHVKEERFAEGIQIINRLSCLKHKVGYQLCATFPRDSMLPLAGFTPDFTVINYIKDRAHYYKLWYESKQSEQLLDLSNHYLSLADSLVNIMKARGRYRGSSKQIDEISAELSKIQISNIYVAQESHNALHTVMAAFNTSERVKQLAISEHLHERLLTNDFGLPAEVIERERNYINRLTELVDLSKTASEDQMLKIAEDLKATRALQAKHQEEIKTSYPNYYNLLFSPAPLSIADIRQHIIGSNEVLLQFLESGQYVYLVAINQDNHAFVRIDLDKSTKALSKELKAHMLSRSDQVFPLLHKMYKELVAPVSSLIEDRDIVVIPDGYLWHIPFNALITKESGPKAVSSDQHYLINSHDVRYLISGRLAYLHAISDKKKAKKARGVLCMTPLSSDDLGDFQQLKASKETQNLLKGLSDSYYDHYFQDQKASVGNFLRHAPKSALLHIGTHTKINDQDPESSFLVFGNGNSNASHASLTASRIYELNLPAQLAVLSACSTAEGILRKGQGITNLARAFAYAGCQNMVINLWDIKDQTSKELMESFYPLLLNTKKSMVESFATSQRTYIKNAGVNAHPSYWATSIYIGDNQGIDLNDQLPSSYYFLVCAVAIIFFIFQIYRFS